LLNSYSALYGNFFWILSACHFSFGPSPFGMTSSSFSHYDSALKTMSELDPFDETEMLKQLEDEEIVEKKKLYERIETLERKSVEQRKLIAKLIGMVKRMQSEITTMQST